MTALAVLFMSSAVLFVVVLTAWCYYRVLRKPSGASQAATGPESEA